MSERKYVDFYRDGEKEVLVQIDHGTLRWVTYNIIASYIGKLKDKYAVLARGSDRVAAKAAMEILETIGAQLLLIAEAAELGPPESEEQIVTLKDPSDV